MKDNMNIYNYRNINIDINECDYRNININMNIIECEDCIHMAG
jgi:hypothetical protein